SDDARGRRDLDEPVLVAHRGAQHCRGARHEGPHRDRTVLLVAVGPSGDRPRGHGARGVRRTPARRCRRTRHAVRGARRRTPRARRHPGRRHPAPRRQRRHHGDARRDPPPDRRPLPERRGLIMAEPTDARVAVYLDFDNIVISWYDRVHGRNAYGKDRQRITENPDDPEVADRLKRAMIEVGAIIDYAASFGTLVLTRAYADWSSPVNAEYRSQLVARAVDLVQLFPAAAYAKNGADIRLAVDAVEDMFRLPDLTHVVIVAGDSDYVPLAQ